MSVEVIYVDAGVYRQVVFVSGVYLMLLLLRFAHAF